jgi:hypothetical protein
VDARRQQFLTAVLGETGSAALMKACERSEALDQLLVPRAILAWVNSASLFDGEVPGLTSHVMFEKSESGFAGSIELPTGVYKFENASVFHIVASVAGALGVDTTETTDDLRDLDIERLGKSVDLLAKVRRVRSELEKSKPKEERGNAAAPVAPASPAPPTPTAPPQHATTKPPKLPKPPSTAPKAVQPAKQSMKLTRSEMERPCASCGRKQFVENTFCGCVCWSVEAPNVSVIAKSESDVTIQVPWTRDVVLAFLESLGRK